MDANALGKLYFRFVSRSERMAEKYGVDSGTFDSHSELRDGRLFCVVRLQHLWGEFCHQLIARSSIGGAYTIERTYLPRVSGVRRWKDVERIAREVTRARRDIPWHIPERSIRIAHEIAPANANRIITALSSVSPIDEIRAIRNYLVHPNASTHDKYDAVARRAGVFDADPDVLLTARISPGNVTMFEYWIIEIQAIALSASR